jgi:hypothetical protein
MFTLGNVLCGLVGLFIDDGTLALAMIAIVMIAGVIVIRDRLRKRRLLEEVGVSFPAGSLEGQELHL